MDLRQDLLQLDTELVERDAVGLCK